MPHALERIGDRPLFVGDRGAATAGAHDRTFGSVLSVCRDPCDLTTHHHPLADGPGNRQAEVAAAFDAARRLYPGSAGPDSGSTGGSDPNSDAGGRSGSTGGADRGRYEESGDTRGSDGHRDPLLVNCAAGVSRSVTVVTTVLAASEGLPFPAALEAVREHRRAARPAPPLRAHAERYLAASEDLPHEAGPAPVDAPAEDPLSGSVACAACDEPIADAPQRASFDRERRPIHPDCAGDGR